MADKLITDEAVEAARDKLGTGSMRDVLTAFIAHHEGERECERCEDGRWMQHNGEEIDCPHCHGTRKVRDDKLVKISEVEQEIRADERAKWPQNAVRTIREQTISEVVALLRKGDGEFSRLIRWADAADHIERMAKEGKLG